MELLIDRSKDHTDLEIAQASQKSTVSVQEASMRVVSTQIYLCGYNSFIIIALDFLR